MQGKENRQQAPGQVHFVRANADVEDIRNRIQVPEGAKPDVPPEKVLRVINRQWTSESVIVSYELPDQTLHIDRYRRGKIMGGETWLRTDSAVWGPGEPGQRKGGWCWYEHE